MGENYLEEILNSIFAGVLVVDEKTHEIVDVNSSALEMIGAPREHVIGKLCYGFICPSEKGKCPISDLGQTVDRSECVLLKADGEGIPILKTVRTMMWRGRKYLIESFIDITERKRVEERLRESEEKYRTQFEEALDAIFIADAETGIIIDCNRAASELVGRAKSELIGKHQRILHPPEETEGEFSRTFKQHLKEKAGEILETQVITKRGEIRNVAIKANVIELRGRKLIQGIFRDITERKKIEEELFRLSNAVRMTADSIAISDLNGNIIDVNDATLKMYGTDDRKDLIGKNFLDFIAPKDREKVLANKEALEKGYVKSQEYNIIIKNGNTIPVEMSIAILKNADEKPVGFVAISRDITERKRIEEDLARERDLLQALMDNISDAIYFKDTASRFTRINIEHAKWLGCNEPEKALGKTDFDFYAEEFAREAYEDEQEIFRTGKPMVGKVEKIKWRDGRFRWVSASKVPIKNNSGQIIGLVGISRDISDLKRMEEELRRYSEHLEELVEERTKELRKAERLATIGETAAMVGHDLRNPLQVLSNQVYLGKKILMEVPPRCREIAEKKGIKELLQIIAEQVEYMNKIVSDLQDYARPLKPELFETNLNQLINETVAMIALPENVKVSIMTEENTPKLMIDPMMMKRVFTNLITNAIQAMPNGGHLTIRVFQSENNAFISVEDTGVGMPKENIENLFQPLFTTKPKGTGFGLPVCKRIVEAHNGEIMVESKVGKGSTFTVRLPLRKEVS